MCGIDDGERIVSETTNQRRAGAKVLLIDDDPDVQALVLAMLRPLEVVVTVAGDGAEGLALAHELVPDLILLDYDLPSMSGLEVLQAVRGAESLARVPVIMVTGSDSHAILASCFSAGAQDYIRKPFFAAELRARVGSAIERQRLLSELVYAAKRDRLTGLPNRAFLHDRLQAAVDKARTTASYGFTLMFLDFDRFKLINDSLGHDVGDMLLQAIASRLRDNLRATDSLLVDDPRTTVARLGGDEFVVLLDGVFDPEIANLVAARLLAALSPAYTLGPHVVRSSASIGIACNGGEYETADDVLRDADIAMYEAKCRGKACAVHFSTAMRDAAATRLTLETDLREAIERCTLQVAYQPIISLDDRSLGGVEALVRWPHPVRGDVPPMEFIPVAEETRLIQPLSDWVLRTACADFMNWQRAAGDAAPAYVSVNLSRVQLTDPTLVTRTLEVVRDAGMVPTQLQLEVTESQIMSNRLGATQLLCEFREAGVRLAMDDFGTGYSSLSCLQEFPLDVLKVDRAFVANLSRGRDFASLVHAVVTLADNLGLEVVAEGIEHVEQAVMLQALGCRFGQGFLLARPMPAAAMLDSILHGGVCNDVFGNATHPATLPVVAPDSLASTTERVS
jgi:diguanylate cyclase (GGDEF)-like protein